MTEVFINGRFLSQRITGVQRYARETLLGLDQLLAERDDRSLQLTLLVPKGVAAPELKAIATRTIGWLRGQPWEQWSLAWHVKGALLLNFGFTGPLLKANQMITLHDAAIVRMPETYSWQFRLWSRFVIGIGAARARRILAVSRFGAGEANECFGVARERIRITTEGWQHLERVVSDEAILDRHGLRGRPFALAVSSPTPNKNFAAIAEAVAMMGAEAPCCVVVGASDSAVFAAGRSDDGLLRVGYVTDEELKALYEHATCFVFPSFYEGFGIPALEAMACGCPVLSSSAAALRETCGDAARYFDPHSPRDLADQLAGLFASPAQRTAMREAGLSRAATYSWRESATLNLDAIEELLVA
jgi:glycosyltransferase involved in cell wall biosynthesis